MRTMPLVGGPVRVQRAWATAGGGGGGGGGGAGGGGGGGGGVVSSTSVGGVWSRRRWACCLMAKIPAENVAVCRRWWGSPAGRPSAAVMIVTLPWRASMVDPIGTDVAPVSGT